MTALEVDRAGHRLIEHLDAVETAQLIIAIAEGDTWSAARWLRVADETVAAVEDRYSRLIDELRAVEVPSEIGRCKAGILRRVKLDKGERPLQEIVDKGATINFANGGDRRKAKRGGEPKVFSRAPAPTIDVGTQLANLAHAQSLRAPDVRAGDDATDPTDQVAQESQDHLAAPTPAPTPSHHRPAARSPDRLRGGR